MHVQPRQRPPAAADHVEGQFLRLFAPARLQQHSRQCAAQHALASRPDLPHAQHAERDRDGLDYAPLRDPNQFQAAAAQIAHDTVGARHARNQTGGGGMAFLLTRQDADGQADLRHARYEVRAVTGLTYRSGRDAAYVGYVHVLAQAAEAGEGAQPPLHRRVADAPRGADVRAKTGQDFFIEQGEGNAARPSVDDQTDAVGADVDDGDAVEIGLRVERHVRRCLQMGDTVQ
jgi:hypothetical protein